MGRESLGETRIIPAFGGSVNRGFSAGGPLTTSPFLLGWL